MLSALIYKAYFIQVNKLANLILKFRKVQNKV